MKNTFKLFPLFILGLIFLTLISFLLLLSSPPVFSKEQYDPGLPPKYLKFDHQSEKKELALGSYLAGTYAMRKNQQELASEYFTDVLKANPSNVNILNQAIASLAFQGKISESILLARDQITYDSTSKIGRLLILVDALDRSDFIKAKNYLDSMPRDDVYSLLVPIINAWINYESGNKDDAILSIIPNNSDEPLHPYYTLHAAIISELSGRPLRAESFYSAVDENLILQTDRMVELRGNFLGRLGKYDEEVELLEDYLSLIPDNYWAEVELIRAKDKIQPKPEINHYRDGIAETFYGISELLTLGSRFQDALIFAQLSIHLRSDFDSASLLLGRIYEALQMPNQAASALISVSSKSSYERDAKIRYALNLADMGKIEDAAKVLRELTRKKIDRLDAPQALGDIFRYSQRFSEAIDAYDIAIQRISEFKPHHWRLLYSRGIALEREKDWKNAEKDFLQALELSPEQPLVLNYLGYSWLEQGENFLLAKDMIEKAVNLKPNDGYIVDSLGWAFYCLGDFKNAVQYLERAVELMPGDPIINDHLGDAFWQAGRNLEAKYQWQRALTLGADGRDAKIISKKIDRGLEIDIRVREGEL